MAAPGADGGGQAGSPSLSDERSDSASSESGVSDAAADSGESEVTAASDVSDASADGDLWSPVRPACGAPSSHTDGGVCSGSDQLTLSAPQLVVDAGGLPAGWSGEVVVVLTDSTARSYDYPCVGFAADDPRVSFQTTNPTNSVYVIRPGEHATFSSLVKFSSAIPAGTVVRFAAWVDLLNVGCTNGAELQWDATVN
jgi:hypothetical protein